MFFCHTLFISLAECMLGLREPLRKAVKSAMGQLPVVAEPLTCCVLSAVVLNHSAIEPAQWLYHQLDTKRKQVKLQFAFSLPRLDNHTITCRAAESLVTLKIY